MSSTFSMKRLSCSVDSMPMRHLFSPTLLDQDLGYVDTTYYPSKEEKLMSIMDKYLTPAVQTDLLNYNFKLLKNQTKLNLQNIDLQVFPSTASQLTKLTTIDLAGNKLTELPECFGQFKHLQHLNVSRNQLVHLPESLFSLVGILHIDISHNPINELSGKIGHLINLQHLDVSHTNIRYLPAEILRLVMTTIKMDNCPHLNSIELVQRNTHNPISLFETCARQLIQPVLYNMIMRKSNKKKNQVLKQLPPQMLEKLMNPDTCTFCSGPYFEHFVKRYRIIQRQQDDVWIPVEYRMCKAHWNTEKDRLQALFTDLPEGSLPAVRKELKLKI